MPWYGLLNTWEIAHLFGVSCELYVSPKSDPEVPCSWLITWMHQKKDVPFACWRSGKGCLGLSNAVFQCDLPNRWISQRQVAPVSVHCDVSCGVGRRVMCMRHGIPVRQHIGQSSTATCRHRRDMTLKGTSSPNLKKTASPPVVEFLSAGHAHGH